jgi:hypothetical protein
MLLYEVGSGVREQIDTRTDSKQQALVQVARQLALKYPMNQIKTYQNAADSLRAPFWDWASNSNFPDAVTTPTISVCTYPKGIKEEIPNPLYAYTYPSAAAFAGRSTTSRCSPATGNRQLASAGLTSKVVSLHLDISHRVTSMAAWQCLLMFTSIMFSFGPQTTRL